MISKKEENSKENLRKLQPVEINITVKENLSKNNSNEDPMIAGSSLFINNIEPFDKKTLIKIGIAVFYFILIICVEISYRSPLFSESIKLQEKIRKDYNKESSFYNSFNFFSVFGNSLTPLGIFFVVFIFFPLSYSFPLLQSIIYASYLTNFLKITYRNSRPFWESDLLDISCNSGYGNPSGHSMMVSSFYPTLAHIVTNFNFFHRETKGKVLSLIIFILLISIAGITMCSRFILSSHSLNQIIYGLTLGIGIYFIIIHILEYHKYKNLDFINHFKKKIVLIIYFTVHIVLLILLLIEFFCLNDSEIENDLYIKVFNNIKCEVKYKSQMLKNEAFKQGLGIVSLIGSHLGILILFSLLNRKKIKINEFINEWNYSKIKRWLIRLPVIIFSCIPLILFVLVNESDKIVIPFVFKYGISFFFGGIGVFGFGLYFSIICNLANENIVVPKVKVENNSK